GRGCRRRAVASHVEDRRAGRASHAHPAGWEPARIQLVGGGAGGALDLQHMRAGIPRGRRASKNASRRKPANSCMFPRMRSATCALLALWVGAWGDSTSGEPVRFAPEGPYSQYVDPFVGTGGSGFGYASCFPGPQVPYGMIRPG